MKGSMASWMKIGILMTAGVEGFGVRCFSGMMEGEAEQSRQMYKGNKRAHILVF